MGIDQASNASNRLGFALIARARRAAIICKPVSRSPIQRPNQRDGSPRETISSGAIIATGMTWIRACCMGFRLLVGGSLLNYSETPVL